MTIKFSTPIATVDHSDSSIVCWGDSLTNAGYPALLSIALGGRPAAEEGVGGNTSTQVRTRQAADVLRVRDTAIFWSGRNNPSAPTTVRDDTIAMVQHLTPVDKRFLVLSVTNGQGEGRGTPGYDNIAACNAELESTFGERFVDVRSYLIARGMTLAGVTPTAQDLTDVADDTTPASLRIDNIHFIPAVYQIVADLLARQIRMRGW